MSYEWWLIIGAAAVGVFLVVLHVSLRQRATPEDVSARVRAMDLRRGDLIVYRHPGPLSEEQAGRLQQMLSRYFDGQRVAILEAGAGLEVLRPQGCVAWRSAADGPPKPFRSTLLWVKSGPLHHGEDYADTGFWNPKVKSYVVNVGDDDAEVQVSHWAEIGDPE